MNLEKTVHEIYSRQIMMKEVGETGQQKLRDASVLVTGCGGLGAPVLYYLTAMGIGHLGLCDGDIVSLSNLNRQVLYKMEDIGKPKARTAEKRLLELNPGLNTTVYDRFLDGKLAETIIPGYDIAVDCLDNFTARFILNDACIKAGKPFVHAGVGEFNGQLLTVTPGTGPCLRCLFPKGIQKKEPDKPSGVIGATPGVIGALQALEVLKYLLGLPVSNGGMVIYDGLNMSLEKVPMEASPECACASS
jgi:adenylyltransferase/sulfurtransferase